LRLSNPQWDEVELRTGGPPGPALRSLYSDLGLLNKEDFSIQIYSPDRDEIVDEHIIRFLPADGATLDHPWSEHLPAGSFPFAEDIFGDLLFVELSPAGEVYAVKHWYHDGGHTEVVAANLASFLNACRESGA
jgi:hypothetical protein